MGAIDTERALRRARAVRATPEDRHGDAARSLAPRPLSDADRADAATAWAGVAGLMTAATGIAAAADGCRGIATPFTLALQINAIRAAHRLEVLSNRAMGRALGQCIEAAERLPLVKPGLPEFAFDPESLQPVRPACGVTGWSAVACLALADALATAGFAHPTLRRRVQSVVAGWQLSATVGPRGLTGCILAGGQPPRPYAEGRIGHEQTAAVMARRLALDADGVPGFRKVARRRWWEGIGVVTDARAPDGDNPQSVATPEGALDLALLHGWTDGALAHASAHLETARRLYLERGILVVPGEIGHSAAGSGAIGFRLLDPPIRGEHGDGRAWPACPPVAVGAAAAYRALYPTAFAEKLWDTARAAGGEAGFSSGLLADGTPAGGVTLAANARVLLSISARAHGPLNRPHA